MEKKRIAPIIYELSRCVACLLKYPLSALQRKGNFLCHFLVSYSQSLGQIALLWSYSEELRWVSLRRSRKGIPEGFSDLYLEFGTEDLDNCSTSLQGWK